MVLREEHAQVEGLLLDAITSLCESRVTFHNTLAIRAEVVLTADDQEPFCVNLDHVLKTSTAVTSCDAHSTGNETPVLTNDDLDTNLPTSEVNDCTDPAINDDQNSLEQDLRVEAPMQSDEQRNIVGEEPTPSETDDISLTLSSIKQEILEAQQENPLETPTTNETPQIDTKFEVTNGDESESRDRSPSPEPPSPPPTTLKRKRGRPPKDKSQKAKAAKLISTQPVKEETTTALDQDADLSSLVGSLLGANGEDTKPGLDDSSMLEDISEVSSADVTLNTEDGKYKCGQCEFTHKSQAVVTKHYNVHSRPKLVCQYCDQEFENRFLRKQHVKETHIGEKPECKTCKKRFASLASLNIHVKNMHKDIKFHSTVRQCDECSYTTNHYGNMVRHIRTNHQSGQVCCIFCGQDFKNREVLKEHIAIKHPSDRVACQQCSKAFKTLDRLKHHIVKEHGDGADCEDAYKCAGCSFATTSLEILEQHINKDNSICEFCDRQLTCKIELKEHIKLEHADDAKRLECEFCGKVYQSKNGMYSHKKVFHSGETDPAKRLVYTCHVCGKGFPLYDYLKRHIRSHDDDYMPYECPKCHKRFKYHRNCKTHKEGCINTAGYQCHLCGKTLKNDYCLKEHMKNMHTNVRKDMFPCRKCNTLFSYSGSRSKHEKTCKKMFDFDEPFQQGTELVEIEAQEVEEVPILHLEPPQMVVEVGTVLDGGEVSSEVHVITETGEMDPATYQITYDALTADGHQLEAPTGYVIM